MAACLFHARSAGWAKLALRYEVTRAWTSKVTLARATQSAMAISSRSAHSVTPEQAGKLAHERANATTSSPSLATLLSHSGVSSGPNVPMSPPLHLASTYTRPPDGPYHENDSEYTRLDNPTRLLLERTMGELECHGDDRMYDKVDSYAFASGMAGVCAIVMSHKAPVTVLIPSDLYHGVPTVLADVMHRFQVTYAHVDYAHEENVRNALSQANGSDVIVWLETPSNPLCQVIDIETVCGIVNEYRPQATITVVVDSTLAPPCVTQPLRLGADVVLHSGTKYLGGHSDVLLGAVTMSPWTERGRELGPILRDVQIAMGAVASPFDSWLTLRGLRTLHLRVDRQCQTALSLANFLNDHELVTAVHYPGLSSHRQHEVAIRQMRMGFGGILSLELASESQAMAVAGALTLVQRATSLGGTETLVEHRASIEPPGRVTSPAGLLRVSVGLEAVDDLILDFDRALSIAQSICG